MDKAFKDMTLEEQLDHARGQMHFWRDILRHLNRGLTAVTPEERTALRLRVIQATELTTAEVEPVRQLG